MSFLGRVEVGAKPLILRAKHALDSDMVGQLQPGQLLSVLEECRSESGDVRARVALVDTEEGKHAVRDCCSL